MSPKKLVFLYSILALLIAPLAAHAASAPAVTAVGVIGEGIVSPVRMALDSAGTLFVSDPRGGGILKYLSGTTVPQTISTTSDPLGIAALSGGRLLVSFGDRVAILDQSGNETGNLGSGPGQFTMANGIAVAPDGTILVTDSLEDSVKLFNADGTFRSRFGSTGGGSGQLSMPTGIAVDRLSGLVAVADTLNGRVQVFDLSGNPVKSIGSYGSGPLAFSSPQGITFEYAPDSTSSASRMYVVDSFQSTVQAIDFSGSSFLAFIGDFGYSAGKLFIPTDVVFRDADHALLVVNGLGNVTSFRVTAASQAPPPDTIPPTLAIDPVPPVISGGSYTFTGKVEAGATVKVSVNGASASPATVVGGTWSFAAGGLVPGNISVSVTAVDAAGNTSVAVAQTKVNPDNQFTITSSAGTGGSITPGATVSTGTTTKFTVTPNTGFHVVSVVVDGTDMGAITSYTFTRIDANHTIEAIFSNSWPVTATAGTGGSITPSGTIQAKGGSSLTLSIVPAYGYHTDKVTVNGASKGALSSYTVKNITRSWTVNASFALNTYTISSRRSGKGTITAATTVRHGESATFVITPSTGNHVADVTVDGASVGAVTSYTFSGVTGPHTISAVFAVNTYTIASKAGAGGSITPTATVAYGGGKSFSIKPSSGYLIADVTVDGSSVGAVKSYKFTRVAADHTIEATFAPVKPVQISALAEGSMTAARVVNVTGIAPDPSASTVTVNGTVVPVIGGIFSAAVPLADGTTTLSVTPDGSGATVRSVTLGADLPLLTVDLPADGARVAESTVTFSGTAAPGVQVTVAGVAAQVNQGLWSAPVSLAAGVNTIQVTAVDPAGNVNNIKKTLVFDAAKPAVAITTPADDLAVSTPSLGISGTYSGGSVTATVDGNAASVAASGGKFSLTASFEAEGAHAIAVTVTDATGNSSTTVRNVIYDATPPSITVDPADPAAPSIVSGIVEPGSMVTLEEGGVVVGRARVTGDKWTIDLTGTSYDPAALVAVATDAAGNRTAVRVR